VGGCRAKAQGTLRGQRWMGDRGVWEVGAGCVICGYEWADGVAVRGALRGGTRGRTRGWDGGVGRAGEGSGGGRRGAVQCQSYDLIKLLPRN